MNDNEAPETFDELMAELKADPGFREEYESQEPYYNLILASIEKRKRDLLGICLIRH